jgi:hypothetical protein
MQTITVAPIGADPFVAWADGRPSLPPAALAEADELIRDARRLGLTMEGPYVVAGWDTIEAAYGVLREVYPETSIVADPPLPIGPREHAV